MTEFVSCININHRQLYRDFIDTTTKLNISTHKTGRLTACVKTRSAVKNPIYYVTIHRLGTKSIGAGYEFDVCDNIQNIISEIRNYNDDGCFVQIVKANSDNHFIDLYIDDPIVVLMKESNLKLWYHLDKIFV